MIADWVDAGFESRFMVWQSPAGRLHAGGDWCQVIPIAPGMAALTIGDVSGHGTTAAAAMAALRTAVVDAIAEVRLPSAALARANEAAYGFAGGTIATAIVAFIDEREQTLTFANAGHPPPLMVTPFGHAFMAAGVADIPLGIFPVHRPADCVIALPPDALLVFYTDGITEHRRNPVDGERELIEAARAVYARPAINAARGIARRVFEADRGFDDAAALCLRTPSRRRRRGTGRNGFAPKPA